jgi:NADH:ubiquinone oxidoreductase subunit 6 (subunit J)
VITDLIFVALALLTVVPAVWVVFSPNIVHAGFALLFTLMGAAGLYAYLGADFIAVTQVMVYVGGVLVLVLFTVMMTRLPQHGRRRHGLDRYVPAAVFAVAVFGLLYKAITSVSWGGAAPPAQPTTAEIGTGFMSSYIFQFEYVSLVLLAAMIGAAILIREHRNGDGDGDADSAAAPDQEVAS